MPGGLDIERLYDEHAQPLFAFLLNLTRDEADTRDLLQEIFVKLARDGKLLAGIRDERAFLVRLAHNAAIDLMRRRGTRDRTKENFTAERISLFAPGDDPDEKLFRDELSVAVGELPEEQRAVVHLKLWSELTFDAIAVALGISPNTAASRYRYGLDKLRERLRPLIRGIEEGRIMNDKVNHEREPLEQRLARQPLKRIPAAWRAEILQASRRAVTAPTPHESWLSTLNQKLSTLLWPHPKAWAGLAAVWVLILVMNFSSREPRPVMAEKASPPSPEVVAELKKQQLLFAELIGSPPAQDADRRKSLATGPRSERVEFMMG